MDQISQTSRLLGGRAPHAWHEQGLSVWFVEPLGIVTQTQGRVRMTLALARFITGPVYGALETLGGGRAQPVFLIHDWQGLDGYEARARLHFVQWCQQHRSAIREGIVVMGEQRTLMFTTVSMVATMLRALSIPVRVERSLYAVATRHHLRALSEEIPVLGPEATERIA